MTAYAPVLMRILVDCKHTIEITVPVPEVGHEQYCRRCGDWRIVIAHLINYQVKCLSKHPYSRTFGDNKEKALLAARKHVLSNPKHTVQINANGKRYCEIDNVAETLFASPEELRQVSEDAQNILSQLDDKPLTTADHAS